VPFWTSGCSPPLSQPRALYELVTVIEWTHTCGCQQWSAIALSGIELLATQIKMFINLEFDVTALYFCAFYSAVPAGDLDDRD